MVAHWPAVGVNVYTVDPALAVLIVAGADVPVGGLVEVGARESGVHVARNDALIALTK